MPIPVVTIEQMREWERESWTSGCREGEVIRRVGRALASHACTLTHAGDRVLILAGKGNNGADAKISRDFLVDRNVGVLDVTDPAQDLAHLRAFLDPGPHLIIDGLFGIGLNRPLSPEWVSFIETVNKASCKVLSVDVPSGLNADSGDHFGTAIRAQTTLAVGAPKAGLLSTQALPYVGRLEVAGDVGLAPCRIRSEVFWSDPADFDGFPPRRDIWSHKGSHGHVAIFAGSQGYHGAAVLAAKGAQRAQPGLITLYALESVYYVIAAQLQAVMVSPWEPVAKIPPGRESILIGPGLAAASLPDAVKMLTRVLWRDAEVPVVVDASALDWIPLERPRRDSVRVMSPHPGEAARLLRSSVSEVQANRIEAVRKISERYGNAWVILKGYQTVIGRYGGPLVVNSSGNPKLGQGGSGDLLAGYIAGLLAQPASCSDVFKTLQFAVWEHGRAADYLTRHKPNWIVEELATELGNRQNPGSFLSEA